MGKVTNFFGCCILRKGELVREDLWIRNNKVIDPETVSHEADIFIDCSGVIICPGFIDLKLNGAFGVDFQNPSEDVAEGLAKVCAMLPTTGVTYFCPSLVTGAPAKYQQILPQIQPRAPDFHRGAGVIGVHLDGPFITVEGAHESQYVIRTLEEGEKKPMETVADIYGHDLENVAIITLAPEIPGIISIIRELVRWGIKVALGHSQAEMHQGEEAVNAGATMISHLFNAMPNFHHRDPFLVGLVASDKIKHPVRFGLISDGHHVHPAALRMAYRMCPEGAMLISDGQAPLGLGEGDFEVGNSPVSVTRQATRPICQLKGMDKLFGSVCPLDKAVANFVELSGCTIGYALECVTRRPAEAMGIFPQKGSLEFGADADFVLLMPFTFQVAATFIGGRKVVDIGLFSDLSQLTLHELSPQA